jgi:hypothetical protein
MNELSAKLLEAAWQELPAKKRTPERLHAEAEALWITWRNNLIDDWAEAVLPEVERRPATAYYWDTPLGDACLKWLNEHGFYSWETPCYDGEDDDFVYRFVAYWLAIMAWDAFEDMQPRLDYTEAELHQFFEVKKDAPPPPIEVAPGTVQFTLF